MKIPYEFDCYLFYKMNNADHSENYDEMRTEYDFSKLKGRVRGKYVEEYRKGTNVVLLDADVADAFPNEKAVNDALRMLITVARNTETAQQK